MKFREQLARKGVIRGAGVLAVIAAAVWLAVPTAIGQGGRQGGIVRLDSAKDMEMKITDPFTLASVGDLIIMRPTSQLADPAFQSAIKIIKDADFAVGNFEAN